MDLILVTAPSATAFDSWLEDAKAYLRVDGSADDDLILDLVRSAVARLDGPRGRLGRALTTQVWRVTFNEYEHEVPLPLPPLVSVDTVAYFDTLDAPQTLTTADYKVEGTDPGFIRPLCRWPRTYRGDAGIVVTFTAGYGSANDVPPLLKTAILEYTSALYDNRGGLQAIPPIASDIVDAYRTRAF